MAASSVTTSAGRINGIFDVSQLAGASIPEGAVCAWQTTSTDDNDAILPSAANASGLCGVSASAGAIAGGTATSGTDFVLVQRNGRAKCLLATSTTVTRGQQAVVANSSGHVTSRTPYSTSAQCLGWFAQNHTSTSAAEFVEVDLSMHQIEICQQVFGAEATAPGAATKYLGPAGTTTGNSAQVALALATYAGKIRNLRVQASTAPGSAQTGVFVVQKSSNQGSSWSDTALTATISGTGKTAADLSNTDTVAAGDLLAIKVTSSETALAGITASFQIT